MTINFKRTFRTSRLLTFAACSLSFFIPTAGHASLLLGTFSIASPGGGPVNISLNNIDFGAMAGQYDISDATGGFSSLVGTDAGMIGNINNPPYVVNTPVNTPMWLTFAAAPNISFELQVLVGGVSGAAQCGAVAAANQACTPPGSPYNLFNTSATSSTASFDVTGLEIDSSTNTSVAFTGLFTSQFINMNYQQILAIVNGGGTIETSYSGSFSTAP